MALKDFTVLHSRSGTDVDSPLVCCFDGDQLVLAFVERAGLDDYFHLPAAGADPRPRRRTLQEWNLVVQENLDAIAQLIADKYDRGDRSVLSMHGQEHPRVDIAYDDLMQSQVELTDTVLEAKELSEEMQQRSFGS